MSDETMLHEMERGEESQQHLNENADKFNGDCRRVMALLHCGVKLSAYSIVQDYEISDRRLRDCYKAWPNVVKKRWVKNQANGKKNYVEYYIEPPLSKTKAASIAWANDFLERMKTKGTSQANLFG